MNNAVITAASLNRTIQNRTSEQQSVCTSSTEDRIARDNIEDNIIGAIKADVVSTCTTLDGGSNDADGRRQEIKGVIAPAPLIKRQRPCWP